MASANSHLIFSAAFLLALILSHGIISTEQRPLKKCEGDDHISSRRNILEDEDNYEPISATGKSPYVASASVSSAQDAFSPLTPGHTHSLPAVPRVSAETDDFRPTTPGHSPGAGHSTGSRSVGPN